MSLVYKLGGLLLLLPIGFGMEPHLGLCARGFGTSRLGRCSPPTSGIRADGSAGTRCTVETLFKGLDSGVRFGGLVGALS